MQNEGLSGRSIIAFSLLGAALFIPLFYLQSLGFFDFWWWMSTNLVFLVFLGWIADPSFKSFVKEDFYHDYAKKAFMGLGSAVVLYAIFFLGNHLSRQWFHFADPGIQGVYDFKGTASVFRIGLLMLLVIGPGEELFWRGFLQRHYERKLGKKWGYVAAVAIYTGVHTLTGNLMLIVAALFAGLFWGWMYMRYRSMVMNIFSHTAWDIAVFILFPFN